jgi:hypothetical protein
MKTVVNPKKYKARVEYWDKGDGKSNALKHKKEVFVPGDINDVIRDGIINIPRGKSIDVLDEIAVGIQAKYPWVVVKDYVKPKPKRKTKKASTKKYGKKKK